MAKKRRAKNIRRELRTYVIGLTVMMTVIYSGLLVINFHRGLDIAVSTILTMEARIFEANYRKNPQTPLPHSGSLRGYLDWSQAPQIYRQAFPETQHKPYALLEYDHEPHGEDNWEGSHYFNVYVQPLHDGELLRLVADFDASLFSEQELNDFDDFANFALPLGAAYILAMILLLYFFNRRVSKNSQAMSDWATNLSLGNCAENPPDFRYAEFNSVAAQLREAFRRIGNLVERERQFLRNASHELRTPIAVTRTNIELLYRVGIPDEIEEPLERVKRANQTMQQLTETLLWLGRDDEQTPSVHSVVLNELVESVVEEHRYLLTGKSVTVNSQLASIGELLLPKTPLRIVIANLIRNAFQYTQRGEVSIVLDAEHLVVENRDNDKCAADKDESFGLGLTLVQQICKRLSWPLNIVFEEDGVRATLALPANISTTSKSVE